MDIAVDVSPDDSAFSSVLASTSVVSGDMLDISVFVTGSPVELTMADGKTVLKSSTPDSEKAVVTFTTEVISVLPDSVDVDISPGFTEISGELVASEDPSPVSSVTGTTDGGAVEVDSSTGTRVVSFLVTHSQAEGQHSPNFTGRG